MNDPGAWITGPFGRLPPLDKAAFLAHMDFLSAPDQPDYRAPAGDSFRKFNEMLRLGLPGFESANVLVLEPDHVGIECPLRFVKDQHVLFGDEPALG